MSTYGFRGLGIQEGFCWTAPGLSQGRSQKWAGGRLQEEGAFPRWLTWASLHHGCHPRYTVAEDFESKDSSKPRGSCVASDSVALEATPGPFCPALLVEPATKVRLVYEEEA